MQEWGRSSLALVDLREETQRLSAELLQLGPRGRIGASNGKDNRKESRRLEGEAVERLLREIEEKVRTHALREAFFYVAILVRVAGVGSGSCLYCSITAILELRERCRDRPVSPGGRPDFDEVSPCSWHAGILL